MVVIITFTSNKGFGLAYVVQRLLEGYSREGRECGFSIRDRSSKVASVSKHYTMKVWRGCEGKPPHIHTLATTHPDTNWIQNCVCPRAGLKWPTNRKILPLPEIKP
jgi:hypothetical protein